MFLAALALFARACLLYFFLAFSFALVFFFTFVAFFFSACPAELLLLAAFLLALPACFDSFFMSAVPEAISPSLSVTELPLPELPLPPELPDEPELLPPAESPEELLELRCLLAKVPPAKPSIPISPNDESGRFFNISNIEELPSGVSFLSPSTDLPVMKLYILLNTS